MSDYYEILGVPRNADADQIKKAYRKLAMQFHPDRNQGSPDAEARFKEVVEAYEALKDPDRRAAYDRYGMEGMRGGPGGPFAGGFDLHDAIEIFMRDFGGAGGFEEIFGGRRRDAARRRKATGETLRVRVPVNLPEVLNGASRKLRVAVLNPCGACEGTGSADKAEPETCATCGGLGEERVAQRSVFGQFVSVTTCTSCGGEGRVVRSPCPTCHGEGRTRGESEVEVQIPPGVTSDNFITLRGKGNVGPRGGPRGDIVVLLDVQEDPRFVREGSHLMTDVVVTAAQAALGVELEVPLVEGAATVKIPNGIQSGRAVRLRGKGLPDLNSGAMGDLIVRVRVWTPTRLSAEQREAYERLRDVEDAAPDRVEEGRDGAKGFWSRVKEAFSPG
jgi:molecular chaperone DnaJ